MQTNYGPDGKVRFPGMAKQIFLFSTWSRRAQGPIQAPIHSISRVYPSHLKLRIHLYLVQKSSVLSPHRYNLTVHKQNAGRYMADNAIKSTQIKAAWMKEKYRD
jgi:hypothetical protein